MSASQNTVLNTGRQSITHTDTSKIFIGDNRYKSELCHNSDYADLELKAGTVLGRVAATGWVKVCRSDAADGSQLPIGILAEDVTIDGQAPAQSIPVCVGGDVVGSKLIWNRAADNLETTVSARRYKDHLLVFNIYTKDSTELSAKDND
jgi:hypothetical protein